MTDTSVFLKPAAFVDSDHPQVIAFARDHAGAGTDLERAVRLFYVIRDDIVYDPYVALGDPESYRASTTLERGRGFCVPKAALLSACCRVLGIPARVGYGDVRNHLATPKLLDMLGTDTFMWHSYADLFLDGAWVKATPAFNKAMCDKFGTKTLEFDGRTDCLFHPYDREGRKHMEYVRDRGTFADVPFSEIAADFRRAHPKAFGAGIDGDFQAEAGAS